MTSIAGSRLPVKKAVAGARIVGRDLKRAIGGAVAFVRYLTTRERIEVGLGWLATETSGVVLGQPASYVIRIANVCDRPWRGRLVIDITSAKASDPLKSRYASFAKHLTIAPCNSMALEVQYDWLTQVIFVLDGHAFPPDEFHQESVIKLAQLWAVTALLVDRRGGRVDQLTIYQELTV